MDWWGFANACVGGAHKALKDYEPISVQRPFAQGKGDAEQAPADGAEAKKKDRYAKARERAAFFS